MPEDNSSDKSRFHPGGLDGGKAVPGAEAVARIELERRLAECTAQLEAANKELETFSYSVSHDLRAPLRAIEGFARILVEDYGAKLDVEVQRHLGVITSASRLMAKLIEDLLTLSRLTRQEIIRGQIDMTELVQRVWSECDGGRRSIEFTLHPLPQAWGDHALIRRVWMNLLSNAIRFTSGKAKAKIEVRGKVEGGRSIYSVADNGAGFDMTYAERLFGPFQKLHGKAESEGTGVGLAIVQRLVHRHGGKVWAEGKVNEGATFSFSLPSGH